MHQTNRLKEDLSPFPNPPYKIQVVVFSYLHDIGKMKYLHHVLHGAMTEHVAVSRNHILSQVLGEAVNLYDRKIICKSLKKWNFFYVAAIRLLLKNWIFLVIVLKNYLIFISKSCDLWYAFLDFPVIARKTDKLEGIGTKHTDHLIIQKMSKMQTSWTKSKSPVAR